MQHRQLLATALTAASPGSEGEWEKPQVVNVHITSAAEERKTM